MNEDIKRIIVSFLFLGLNILFIFMFPDYKGELKGLLIIPIVMIVISIIIFFVDKKKDQGVDYSDKTN